MRLTTVILLGTMLHLSAATFGQKLNYVNKNVSLEQLFKEIKKQTNYNVVWYEGKLNTARTINADFSNATLDQVMDKALSGLPLTYTIRQNNIVIKEKTPSLLDKVISHFKNTTLFGKVTDEKGNPLPGAIVRIKNTKAIVGTNKDGNFTIESTEEEGILVISFLGYKLVEQSFSPTNTGPFNITLIEDESILNEVQINTGYYTVSDRERTGSISKVTAETIGKQPILNPLQALQGTVPGIQVTQQTGIPGGGFVVQIRGRNSINSGNDPLYIVDGVNYPSTRISSEIGPLVGNSEISPLSMISPNDIESIEILKDADATSIYGSRGANGVVLITTKKGKIGVAKVNAGISNGYSQVAHRVTLLNTDEYIQMRKEAFKNDGLQPGTRDFDINGTWDQHQYTDWQEKLIGKDAKVMDALINISGGSMKNTYIIGANYHKEGTVFPGDFGFKRIGAHSNLSVGSAEDRFNASFTSNFNHTQNSLFSTDLTSYILAPPNQPDSYDEYGKLSWSNNTIALNPMAFLLQTFSAKTDNLTANLTLSYRILKDLNVRATLGYTTIRMQELQKKPLESINPALPTYLPTSRTALFGNSYNNNFTIDPVITYKYRTTWGILDALLGTSFQGNNIQQNSLLASNFTSDDLLENIGSAASITNNAINFLQYRYAAVFARLNYNLNDKYLLNLTARRDGSSRFGPGKQFANFGAIGGAWIFSEETLIKETLPFLNFGKLRANYGLTGNDQIQDYRYLQLWNTNTNTYQQNPTISPGTDAPNADFAWETNRKLEAAIQLGFLKDKINIEISFYRNRSSNQLLSLVLPLSTGLSSVQRNLPAEVQNIGWEFDANFKLCNSNSFKWLTGFNLTIPKNKLISYPGLKTSGLDYKYQIGEPLSILKTYNITVNKQTGLYTREDYNGDGKIDNNDRYLVKFLGQHFYGGLSNSLTYKQFNLDFLFSFTKQNGRDYRAASLTVPGRGLVFSPNNQFSEVLSRWQNQNDEATVQRYGTTSATSTAYSYARNFGNISVVDASYIRLKSVSLSYSFSKNPLSNLKLADAIISLRAQNIFTITNYAGLDPETQGLTLPPLRSIVLGLSLTF